MEGTEKVELALEVPLDRQPIDAGSLSSEDPNGLEPTRKATPLPLAQISVVCLVSLSEGMPTINRSKKEAF